MPPKWLSSRAEWLQKDTFLEAMLHEELARTPPRKAYYPGAHERFERIHRAVPERTTSLARTAEGAVPWTVIPRLDENEYALTHEAFCGVVAEVQLDAPDFVGGRRCRAFSKRAVEFANEKCWGTLSCCVLMHPDSEAAHQADFARMVRDLRYGGIGINIWPAAIYGLVSPTWGAFPGHTPEDIQSGTGVVHNAWLFDHPEKSVLRAPFRIRPTPAWFSDHRNLVDARQAARPTRGGAVVRLVREGRARWDQRMTRSSAIA